MVKLIDRQPFKTIYLVYFAATLVFVKIPCWTLWYLRPPHRPRPSWTLKRALIVRIMKELFTIDVKIGNGEDTSMREIPDSELQDAKFTWVEPIPDGLFCGEVRRLADITGAQPTKRAGFWLLKKDSVWLGPKAQPGEKTVMHLHGGAFYIGSANPSDITSNFTRGLLAHSTTLARTFAVDYRLTASDPDPPANPFPAALLDALAGYRYLVLEAGFAPQNIIVAGDSAGANLAVALVRYLLENPIVAETLPPPGGIVTASGWLDLSMSRRGPDSSAVRNAPTDIFDQKPGELFGRYGVMGLLGPLDFEVAQTNRYLSPVSTGCTDASFKGFPETYVVAGGAERLLDDSTALVDRMRKDGVQVVQDIPPDAVHDFLVFTWHEPERTEVLKRVAGWIDAFGVKYTV